MNANKIKPTEIGGHVEKSVSMRILQAPPICEDSRDSRALLRFSGFTASLLLLLAGCAGDIHHKMIVSAADQKMLLFCDGRPTAVYPVSTSKFGLGDRPGSCATPLGTLRVKRKIGGGSPAGAVFKSRRPTGEVIRVNAPGRDPIVTRILWLEGTEPRNRRAFARCIYIHGTPEERNIGYPASYGCIRMRSADIIELFDTVGIGARVFITTKPLPPRP